MQRKGPSLSSGLLSLDAMEKIHQAKQKILDFREKIQGLSKPQKLLIVILVLAVPAGIAIATALLLLWKGKKK